MMNRTKLLKIAVLCVVSAIGNILGSLFHTKTGLPLYIDTIFNAAICFSAGLVPALVTVVLVFPMMDFLLNRYIRVLPVDLGFFANIWVICMLTGLSSFSAVTEFRCCTGNGLTPCPRCVPRP